jgi:polyhydroxyalkanoate synthesis regulator phasin
MTIDPTFTANTEIRLQDMEKALADIWRLLQNVVNKDQFNRLNILRQREMTSFMTRVSNLESRVETLENEYNSLI